MQRQRDIFNGSILEIYHESTKNLRRLLIVTSATLYYNTARSRGCMYRNYRTDIIITTFGIFFYVKGNFL